jgi:hypothetical protein
MFPEHSDIAAERHDAELPPGAGPVGAADEFWTEADREHLNAKSGKPRHNIMAQFVDGNEESRDRQKASNVKQARRGEFHHTQSLCPARGRVRNL